MNTTLLATSGVASSTPLVTTTSAWSTNVLVSVAVEIVPSGAVTVTVLATVAG
ncbi:hypothetical protein [Arenimonas sp.]|uniref:hypothetical protein n=1 Tax=Arenimonas sp. TaxID=1872635 RepID=UPI002D804B18|nr:hypothetical protein [Arenimonas sp.]